MELWRYIRTLRRRFLLVLFVWALCIVGVVWLARYQAKGFSATATIKEQIRDYDVTVTVPRVQIEPQDARLFSLISYITSRTVVEQALEDIGVITPRTPEDERATQIEVWSSSKRLTAAPAQARAPLVQVTVRTEEPPETGGQQARAFCEAVLREFERFYKSMNVEAPLRAVQTLDSQLADAEKEARDYLQQAQELAQRSGMTVFNAETEASRALDTLINARTSYDQARLSVRQYQESIDILERKLDELEIRRTSQSSTIPNPLYQQLLQQLEAAQVALNEQLANRTPKHPDVIIAQEAVNTFKERLAQTPERIQSVQVTSPNPVADDLVNQLNRYYSLRDGQKALEQGMKEVYNQLKARANSMPGVSAQMTNLMRQYTAANDTYRAIAERLGEAQLKLNDARTRSAIVTIDNVSVSRKASNLFLYAVLAVVLGFVLACGVAFLAAYMDNTIRTPEQAESLLQLPMYATLPKVRSPRLEIADPTSATVAAFEMLSTNLWLSDPEVERPTFLVASALPDVGRSTVAANLSITLARDGARVILVDADFRDPQQHIAFGVSNDSGFSNVLAGDHKIEDVLVKTNQENLLLIPSGPLPQNPIRLLRGRSVEEFVERITGFADFVIFDSPAGVTFADASLLAAAVRNVIVVHQAGRVPRGAEDEFRRRLERVDAHLVGAVLNRVRREDSHAYYHFHRAYKGIMAPGKYGDVRALPRSDGDEV
jgi:succinoglycan biosynthesis transport protein ExoP